ncbi:MAG: (d)CMP kinase [Candidatus Omnitrophota bacterium]
MTQKSIIIAIDGPAGAGKSTIAKRLAKELNISYLDTGAMYRAVTLKALQSGADLAREEELAVIAEKCNLEMEFSSGQQKIFLDGKEVTEDIRTLMVTNNTKYIANCPSVRTIVVNWQRKIADGQSIVMEGRDIGTVVFPKADYKFYLDADINERTQRRLKEIQGQGKLIDENQLTMDIAQRDQKDMERETGPLCKADDAVVIDSTNLSIQEVVDRMLQVIKHG